MEILTAQILTAILSGQSCGNSNGNLAAYFGYELCKLGKFIGYGCGSDQGESLESVWGTIKSHYNLGES